MPTDAKIDLDGEFREAVEMEQGGRTIYVIDEPIGPFISTAWNPIQRWSKSLSKQITNYAWNPRLKTWTANRKPNPTIDEDYSTVLNDTTAVEESVLRTMHKWPAAKTNSSPRHKKANDLRLNAIREVWRKHLAIDGIHAMNYKKLAKACGCGETEIKMLDKKWRAVENIPQQQLGTRRASDKRRSLSLVRARRERTR